MVFLVLLIILCASFGAYYYFSHSMEALPQGDFLCESTSPQGTYTIRLYETNPALPAGGLRGELIINGTNKKHNIYWEYNRNINDRNINGNEIIWVDNTTVMINGRRLVLPDGKYDWRYDK